MRLYFVLSLRWFFVVAFEARLAHAVVVMGHEDETAALAFSDFQCGFAARVFAVHRITLSEFIGVNWVEALITCHEIKRTFAMSTLP